MIDHDLSVSEGPARRTLQTLEVLIAPSGALRNVLVFKANHDGMVRFQASILLNEIALKSHRTVVIHIFTKVFHYNRFNMFSVQSRRYGAISGLHIAQRNRSQIAPYHRDSPFY